MKNLLILLIFFCASTMLIAQVEVEEGTRSMIEGNYNAYSVSLENVKKGEAEDAWKDFMKDYKAKVKNDKKAKLYFSDNVQIPSISSNPLDIYTSFSESSSKTIVTVWFDTGSGYVNSIDMEAQSETAQGIVTEYGTKVMRKHYEEIQKKEEDRYKDLSNDAKDLENKNKDLREDIAKAKTNILKWEKELEQNEDNITKKSKEIKSQGKVLNLAKETTRRF